MNRRRPTGHGGRTGVGYKMIRRRVDLLVVVVTLGGATTCGPEDPGPPPTVRTQGAPAVWVLDSVPLVTIG